MRSVRPCAAVPRATGGATRRRPTAKPSTSSSARTRRCCAARARCASPACSNPTWPCRPPSTRACTARFRTRPRSPTSASACRRACRPSAWSCSARRSRPCSCAASSTSPAGNRRRHPPAAAASSTTAASSSRSSSAARATWTISCRRWSPTSWSGTSCTSSSSSTSALRELVEHAADVGPQPGDEQRIQEALALSADEWARLGVVWRGQPWAFLAQTAARRKRLALRMLGGTWNDYERNVEQWFAYLAAHAPGRHRRAAGLRRVQQHAQPGKSGLGVGARAPGGDHRLHPSIGGRAAPGRVRGDRLRPRAEPAGEFPLLRGEEVPGR